MGDKIIWVIARKGEEGRHASGQNLVLIEATTPQEARIAATSASKFGESFMCPHGYVCLAIGAFMREMDGIALIRADMPLQLPEGTPWAF